MHILLTDTLSCPRCGPEFGLVLLAHRVEERRVLEGELGCPNCRVTYPVRGGFGDLRPPPRDPLPVAEPAPPEDHEAPEDDEAAVRLGALLGLTGGPGGVVLVEAAARAAPALAAMIEEVRVVAVESVRPAASTTPPGPGGADVSRIATGARLPFFSRTIRGVALEGGEGAAWIEEAARVVATGGRVVVVDAPPGARDRLESTGLAIVLDDAGVVVATRE